MATTSNNGNGPQHGVEEDVAATLNRALDTLKERRAAEHKALDERFDFREQTIRQALEGLTMAFGEIKFDATTPPAQPEEGEPKLSISEKHLRTIEGYLAEHGKVRQADLVDKLSLNSGTVSVGLRVLERSGLIKKAPKERGSRVWEHDAPQDKKRRETVIKAGEGVREGRLVHS